MMRKAWKYIGVTVAYGGIGCAVLLCAPNMPLQATVALLLMFPVTASILILSGYGLD